MPVDTLDQQIDQVLGNLRKAPTLRDRQISAPPQPKQQASSLDAEIDSVLSKQRPSPLEPPPVISPYKDYGPKWGAVPPALGYAAKAAEAPTKFAKWFGNLATGGGDAYKGSLGWFLAGEQALANPLPLLNKITGYGTAPKGIEEEIKPEEYADWVREKPWLMHSVELLRHAGRASSEILSDPTTWLFAGSGGVRPGLKLLIDAGFTALQAHGTYQSLQAAKEAAKSGDWWGENGFVANATSGLINGAFAAGAAAELRPKTAAANWRLGTIMMEAEKASQRQFGKSWTELDPAQRSDVVDGLSNILKKPAYQQTASELVAREYLADLQAVQRFRNDAQRGQPSKMPERLRGLPQEAVEAMTKMADQQFPDTSLAENAPKRPELDVKALTPESIQSMSEPDLERVAGYFHETPDTPETENAHKLVEQERLRRLILDTRARAARSGIDINAASAEQGLSAFIDAENSRSKVQHEDLLRQVGITPPVAPESRAAAAQGLRDLIKLNRRQDVARAVDKIIANAPEKRPAQAEPVILKGKPQTPDEAFDAAVEAAKAEIGEKEAADARRLMAERDRLIKSIRQGADRLEKEEAERIARAEEESPKVADKRRFVLEQTPEKQADKLAYAEKPYEETALVKGRPLSSDEAFEQRRQEVLEEIHREKLARLKENEQRIIEATPRIKGAIQRARDEYLQRTSEEAENAARGFKIRDLRGQDKPETAPLSIVGEKPAQPSPKSAETAGKPATTPPAQPLEAPPAPAAPTKAAQAAPTYEIPPETRVGGVTGAAYTLNVEGRDVPVVAKIVKGSDLKPSHDPGTFAVVKGGISDANRWGRKLQPRNYDTDTSAQLAVEQHANKFVRGMAMTPDPTTTVGPPVILPDGTVMGGNSRTMSMLRMYSGAAEMKGDAVREGIVQTLRENLAYGISPDAVPPESDHPILVWQLTEPPSTTKELGILADDLNPQISRSLSEIEEGITIGQRVSDEVMQWIADRQDELGKDATMLDVIHANSEYLASAMQHEGWFSATQRTKYVDDASGKLTEAGRKLIPNAMLGKVFDDPVLLQKAPDGVLEKMRRALPVLLRMKRHGGVWNLMPYVEEAIKIRTSADSAGKSVDLYLHPEKDPKAAQRLPGFERQASPIAEAIAKKLDESGLQFKRALADYMVEAGVAAQPTLGFEPPQAWDSFNQFFAKDVGVTTKADDFLKMSPPPPSAQNTVVEPLKNGEPPVPSGSVRLYRGEPVKEGDGKHPDWLPKETKEAFGRWFGKTVEAARWYVSKSQLPEGGKGRIVYVDVPAAEADKYLVKNLPEEVAKFSSLPDEEYFVPREVAGKAKEIPAEVPPPLEAKKSKSGREKKLEPPPVPAHEAFQASLKKMSMGDLINLHGRLAKEPGAESAAKARLVADEMNRREGGGPPAELKEPKKPKLKGPNPTIDALDTKIKELKQERDDAVARDEDEQAGRLDGQIREAEQQLRAAVDKMTTKEPPAELAAKGFERFDSMKDAHEALRKGTLKAMKVFMVDGKEYWLDEQGTPHRKFANIEAAPKDGGLAIPGMAEAAAEAHETRGRITGEQLTQAIKTPETQSISKATGEMERSSPLFGGKEEVTGQKGFGWGSQNTATTLDEAAKLREAIRKKTLGGGLKAGLDPSVFVDIARLGAFHVEAGARAFLDWSNRMVSDLGEWVRPHLRDVWVKLPIIAREDAQRKIKVDTPPAVAKKLRDFVDLLSELEEKPLGLVDLSGREVQPDVHRGLVDEAGRSEDPRRIDQTPDEAAGQQRPVSAKPDEGARPPRGSGGERGAAAPGETRTPKPKAAPKPKPLADIKPVDLQPVKSERPPVVSEDKWRRDLYRWKMPETMPPPTVSLSPAIDSKLMPFQSMLASRAVSTLLDNDAVILAAPKGGGKTFIGSGIIGELLDRMGPNKDTATVLVMAPSKALGKKWIDTLSKFGLHAEPMPKGAATPEKPGIYTITYAASIRRPGIEKFKWDVVLTDESQWARRWYAEKELEPGKAQAQFTQGQLTRDITNNARKAIYVSATPWHNAMEIGYMEKLGLWKPGQFENWVRQFGVTRTDEGWNIPPNPQRLVKLWSQLVEQGRLIGMDHNLEGQKVQFAMVPLSDESRGDIRNIVKAFQLGQEYYRRKGSAAARMRLSAQAVTYMKAYLERTRLDAVSELTKKLNDQGWKVAIFSESHSKVGDLYKLLKEADEHYGGEINRLMPKLPSVSETLQQKLGPENLALYMGSDSPQRTEQLQNFQNGTAKNIFATYAAGGVGVDMHDTIGDQPRAAIYLGPPWSGMLLDQSLGRIYRVGSRSEGYHLFVSSNSRPEVELLLGKVAPRLESLRAMVNGIAKGEQMVEGFRNFASALNYAMGDKEDPDVANFQNVADTSGMVNYKGFAAPSARDSMHKPMQLERLEAPPEPRIVSGKELPKELEAPKSKSKIITGPLYSGIDPEVAREALKKTAKDVAGIASKVSKAIGNELAGRIDYVPDDPAIQNSLDEIRSIMRRGEAKQAVKETFPSLYDKDAYQRAVSISADAAAIKQPHNPDGAVVSAWRDDLGWLQGIRRIAGKAIKAADTLYMHAVRSGIGNIEALGGDVGKRITYNIRDYHVRAGNMAGEWKVRVMDIVDKYDLSTPERMANLFDAVERDTPPLDDKIAHARDEMRGLMREIATRAKSEGVQVEVYDPDEGKKYVDFPNPDPNYMPRTYDPEIYKKGEKRHEQVVRRLMDRRGITETQARSILERMRSREVPLAGNLEKAREFDLLDEHEKTVPALFKYLESAGEVIARTEVFGQRRGKLESDILDVKGYDDKDTFHRQEEIRQIMDRLLERYIASEGSRALLNFGTNWTIFSKMTMSAIPMMTHTLKGAVLTGDRAFLRALYDSIRDNPAAMREAIRSGAVSDHIRGDILKEMGGSGDTKSSFLKYYQIYNIDKWSRLLADGSARNFLEQTVLPALKRSPGDADWNRILKDKFMVTDGQIKDAVSKGFWSQDALDRAGKSAADASQGTWDPTEVPPLWRMKGGTRAGDTAAAMVRLSTMLKGYIYRNGRFFADNLISEGRRGNFRPWIPVLTLMLPVGEVINGIRDYANGKKQYMQETMKLLTGQGDFWTGVQHFGRDIGFMIAASYLSMLLEATWSKIGALKWAAGPFLDDAAYTLDQVGQASHDFLNGNAADGVRKLWAVPTTTIKPLHPLKPATKQERRREALGLDPTPWQTPPEFKLPDEYRNQAF